MEFSVANDFDRANIIATAGEHAAGLRMFAVQKNASRERARSVKKMIILRMSLVLDDNELPRSSASSTTPLPCSRFTALYSPHSMAMNEVATLNTAASPGVQCLRRWQLTGPAQQRMYRARARGACFVPQREHGLSCKAWTRLRCTSGARSVSGANVLCKAVPPGSNRWDGAGSCWARATEAFAAHMSH